MLHYRGVRLRRNGVTRRQLAAVILELLPRQSLRLFIDVISALRPCLEQSRCEKVRAALVVIRRGDEISLQFFIWFPKEIAGLSCHGQLAQVLQNRKLDRMQQKFAKRIEIDLIGIRMIAIAAIQSEPQFERRSILLITFEKYQNGT